MNEGIRSSKTLSSGMLEAHQGNIQGRPKHLSLGTPRMASPLCLQSIGILLGAIFLFITWYEFCLECLVLFASLLVSLPQSSLLYTPFERSKYLLVSLPQSSLLHLYLLSLIVLLIMLHLYLLSVIIFALMLHLDLLEHGGGFVLNKLLISHASLRLFWESLIAWWFA